jgi:hypothetical protein
VLGLSALGCATPTRTRRVPRRPSTGTHRGQGRAARPQRPPANEGAALVERALHDEGLRFRTGRQRAARLWGYMRSSHSAIDPADARPGDVVFFDTRGTDPEPQCADHAALVESAEVDGRIGFVEARGGRCGTATCSRSCRRSAAASRGQILNTFLRPSS